VAEDRNRTFAQSCKIIIFRCIIKESDYLAVRKSLNLYNGGEFNMKFWLKFIIYFKKLDINLGKLVFLNFNRS